MKRRIMLVVVLVLVSAPLTAQRTRRTLEPLPTLSQAGASMVLTALRGGGYILACRHAITDRRGNQRRPFDINDRSTQRNLSVAGERQAQALGRALEALRVPIGEVYSSPYARTMESAQLAFDRATPDDQLYGNHSARDFRERFNRAPRDGNTVLMTHQAVLRAALRYRQPDEGDCIVVRPGREGPHVIANVTVAEWEQLASREVNRA